MRSAYKRLGDYIKEVNTRNSDLKTTNLLGVNIDKYFMPSVANVIGTDMSVYKIVRKGQFACNRMHVGRDYRLPVALSESEENFLVSPAYDVFEVSDTKVLLPEYLMMWFSRAEFDRNAWFYTDADVRGGLHWKAFCDMQLPVPDVDVQSEIVKEYHTIVSRIKLNEQFKRKLEQTAQTLYKQWFVDFEFLDETGKPYKSNGGEMVWCEEMEREIPQRWGVDTLKNVTSKIGSGSTPTGGKNSYHRSGVSLVRSLNVYDYSFSYNNLAFLNDSQARALNGASLERSDIMLNITGVSVGRCCIVPASVLPGRVNQHVLIIRAMASNFPYYILCTLCYNETKSKLLGISASGSTRDALTKTDIENFSMLIPSNSVLDSFQRLMTAKFSMLESVVLQNKSLIEFKNIIFSKMSKPELLETEQPA